VLASGLLVARGAPGVPGALPRPLDGEADAQGVLPGTPQPRRRRRRKSGEPWAFREDTDFGRAWQAYVAAIKEHGCRGEEPVPTEERERLFYARAGQYGAERVALALVGWGEEEWAREEPRRHSFEVLIGQPKSVEHYASLAAAAIPSPESIARAERDRLGAEYLELASSVCLINDPRYAAALDLYDKSLYDLSVLDELREAVADLTAARAGMTAEELAWTQAENATLRRAAFPEPDLSGVLL
jgi:hypothetical protein